MNKMVAFICLFSSLAVFSADLEAFNKRFTLKRNDSGELVSIKLKTFTKKFSLKPFISQVKKDIELQIKSMKQKSSQREINEFIEEISQMDENFKKNTSNDNPRMVRRSLLNLPKINIKDSFANIKKSGVLKKFELDLKNVLKMLDLSIIADPTDARFFYRKKVTYEVVKRALEFAKKRLDNVPLLNLASFVIVKVHDLVLEQRTFNQNILLHYLETVPEAELGMTKSEVDTVLSSIYESRIAPVNFIESRQAAADWANYGVNKFFTVIRGANTRARRSVNIYTRSTSRINYAFIHADIDGERKILNAIDSRHMFNAKMPIAYHYDNPAKVKRFRSLLNLANIGLGFLPIPGWIKSNAQSFVESFYEKQRQTEGALIAFFESNGNQKMLKEIKTQIRNPYLVF